MTRVFGSGVRAAHTGGRAGKALVIAAAVAACWTASGCSSGSTGESPNSQLSVTASSGGQSSPDASLPTLGRSATPAASGAGSTSRQQAASGRERVPAFSHIVVVLEENHSYPAVSRNAAAPYLNRLAGAGVRMTASYAITHPSQPNYLALFAGSTEGVAGDACPQRLGGANLAVELSRAGRSFTGYSESLPATGFTGCSSGGYARKHAPWVDFALPPTVNRPFSAFPRDYNQLPTVSFVVPNLQHDMHDGTIRQADDWLQSNLAAYARWSVTHNSLLIVTFDEGADNSPNQILTVLYGSHLFAGTDGTHVTHYSILRTIEDAYRLPLLGNSATAKAITADWQP